MKKVLIVNKFYYPRGGDCVCSINLEKLLGEKGHQTAIYAMDYCDNIECLDSGDFASTVDFSGGIKDRVKAVGRVLGYGDIRRSFTAVMNKVKPDVVHLQNIHSYLSPIVAEIAKEHGARVVWTLHDYKLICPSYSCLRNGQTCELCFADKSHVLRERCMKGSLAASLIAYMESLVWNKKRLQQCTDKFVCPSRFMKEKMIQGGYREDKLEVLCNFVDPVKLADFIALPNNESRQDYCIYVGRLSKEKGVGTLLAAIKECGLKIKIAGGGPLSEEFRQMYGDCDNVEFLGHQDAKSVAKLLSGARFSVVPSECYDNNPLSLIESLCAGTPVVGTKIGGIPELINPDNNGIIVEPSDAASLKNAIVGAFNRSWDYEQIKKQAIEDFSPDAYYDKIIGIYNG